MKLKELNQHVKDGHIQEVNLLSMEGGSYVMHAVQNEESHPLDDAHGHTLHVASVDEARKLLAGIPKLRLFLVQSAVHDEMAGLAEGAAKDARQSIPLRSSL